MLNWHVMRSKPNKEGLLHEQLSNLGIETYYPCLKVKPVNPRASKIKPYFPGYLFIKTDLAVIGPSALQWIPGAMDLVKFGEEFAHLDEGLIQMIRLKVDEINAAGANMFEFLKPGDLVTIQSGPFAGYRAIFDSRLSGRERVRVLLQLLQDQQLSLELSLAQIQPLETSRAQLSL